jgi:hypothetical protein
MESEEDGHSCLLVMAAAQCCYRRDGAGAPGEPPKAEPGAGSAGRGAAGAAVI